MAPGAALFVPVLVVMTSALGVRAVVTLAPAALPSLLPGVGSGVLDLLLAIFETLTPAGATKLMLRVVLA